MSLSIKTKLPRMDLKLSSIWLLTMSQTSFPTFYVNLFHMSVTGFCGTKNTWSRLLDQVSGTYCCLYLKHSSSRNLYFGSVTVLQVFVHMSTYEDPPWSSHSLFSSSYSLHITYVHLLHIHSLVCLPPLESKLLWGQVLYLFVFTL